MSFVDDVRYAARSLARRPTLLAVTTITLLVGIAANAIMFGIVDQLLLRPPAHVTSPDRVKRIYYRDVEDGHESIGSVTTYPVLPALWAGAAAFSELALRIQERVLTRPRSRRAQRPGAARLGQLSSVCSAFARRSDAPLPTTTTASPTANRWRS